MTNPNEPTGFVISAGLARVIIVSLLLQQMEKNSSFSFRENKITMFIVAAHEHHESTLFYNE
jgi:hypothetical protein